MRCSRTVFLAELYVIRACCAWQGALRREFCDLELEDRVGIAEAAALYLPCNQYRYHQPPPEQTRNMIITRIL